MLSQSSISSKGRTVGWAKSFLGAAHREQPAGTGGERVPADGGRVGKEKECLRRPGA
jgi:hypothetical protein